ncbi:MAG TPA: hypothetical protein VGD53_10535 [Actinoallomurus sp.]|jgi:hypothetical protein
MSARRIVGLEKHLVTEPVLATWRDLDTTVEVWNAVWSYPRRWR